MERKNDLENYANKLKAQDRALWLNFEHRLTHKRYIVVSSFKSGYFVVPNGYASSEDEQIEELPNGYSGMTYTHIQLIGMDVEPLNHWEEIKGMFSVMHGEILRFLLAYNVPLEKFIRMELANRGYDKDHLWVGFEKAREIWIGNE